jgi:hypothetical protein
MARIQEYLSIAEDVYAQSAMGPPQILGWERQKWEWATWYGNGFQGGVFENEQEIIVAFSGTKGGLTTAPISQNTANARIGVKAIPNMAGSAFAMVNWAKEQAAGVKQVSLVGHSLGGGLAQVVGNWSGCPFISFNGPGMATNLKLSAFNIFKPMQMARSIGSGATGDTIGIGFVVKGDFVGEFGTQVGLKIELVAAGMDNKHSLDAVFTGLGMDRRAKSPRDLLSIWPAPPSGRARR